MSRGRGRDGAEGLRQGRRELGIREFKSDSLMLERKLVFFIKEAAVVEAEWESLWPGVFQHFLVVHSTAKRLNCEAYGFSLQTLRPLQLQVLLSRGDIAC